jgi:undecaprenyl-diphosphatase
MSDSLEQFVAIMENYGVFGLFLVSFCEAIFSPILPDIMLIPMALAVPEMAIYYSLVATLASIGGGFVGYGIGYRFGPPLIRKCVAQNYIDKIRGLVARYGGWAIWIAAMSPVPYKFVSISSGAFRINKVVFLLASVFGRAKRFLLEGVLIYYYGPKAISLMSQYTQNSVVILAALVIVILGAVQVRAYLNRKKLERCGD